MKSPQTTSDRSTPALALRSLLGAIWFSFWFFGAIPAAILWASGGELDPPFSGWSVAGGTVVLVAGIAILWPVTAFVGQGRGTPVPLDPPRRLVERGLYRWVRNPMYLLYIAVVIGEAMIFRSAWLLAWAVALGALSHWFVVKSEEPGLRRRFGAAYDDYCQRVPRWLPRRPQP